jgi:methionine biosynthesis protein MetW
VRLSLLFGGRMPRTRALSYHWYDTPNIHLCTLSDFVALARSQGAVIDRALALKRDRVAGEMQPHAWGPNLFAQGAIFLLRKS